MFSGRRRLNLDPESIKAIEVELSPQVEEKTKLSEKKAAKDCKINQLKDEIEKKKEEIEQKKKKLDDLMDETNQDSISLDS